MTRCVYGKFRVTFTTFESWIRTKFTFKKKKKKKLNQFHTKRLVLTILKSFPLYNKHESIVQDLIAEYVELRKSRDQLGRGKWLK